MATARPLAIVDALTSAVDDLRSTVGARSHDGVGGPDPSPLRALATTTPARRVRVSSTTAPNEEDPLEAGDHQLVVLDEVTYPINWSWIDLADVVATITGRPRHVNVICTGRQAPAELIEIADTVTEMASTKHAYEAGIRAKKGIDY